MKRLLIAATAVGALSTPALADFWVVRDNPTADCRIVESKPSDSVTIVGNTIYKTRDEATTQMTTICKK